MNKGIEARLASLTPDRIKMLVDRLQASPAAARPRADRMPRVPDGRYPLSGAQERMWFLCQLSPGSPVFNNPAVLRMFPAEPLDRERLQRSLDEVVRRHEILRTTFHDERGTPGQVVHGDMPIEVGWLDLRSLAAAERESAGQRLALAHGRQPFDLTRGPLIAVTVVQLGDLEYLLLVTSHHIISDGWSNAMFSKELSAIYSAGSAAAAGLATPELQYVDYVQWERSWMASDAYQREVAYWTRQLAEHRPPLRLPADRARGAAMSHAGGLVTTTMEDGLAEALRRIAKQQRVSLFQLLMTGLVALLHRYSGESTVTVGTLTANRNRREFQQVMGLFMNTLVIRTAVEDGEPFLQLARRVQAVCQDALAHQDLPFDRLVSELKPPRQLNVPPIFQVMFVHQNVPSLYEVPGMRLELVKVDYGTSKFDLNLWAEEVNGELRLTLYYARDLFDAAAAERILGHYLSLLASAAGAPDAVIGDLQYFSPAPAPAVRSPDPVSCVHRRFEAHAARGPQLCAADGPEGSFTYGELNAYANQVARRLRARGASQEAPVALLAHRSPRTIALLMGILKAGAAYLPLDPAHPSARLVGVVADAGCRLLVTDARTRPIADAVAARAEIVDVDEQAAAIAAEAIGNLDGADAVGDLAYVIYTSGTTGAPKGVAVEHRNLSAYGDAIWRVMRLPAGARCATISSLAADLGNTMIFPALVHGATVVTISEDLATDAVGLAAYLDRSPVDALKIVPSHLRALLDAAPSSPPLPRQLVVLGGESSRTDLVHAIRRRAPALRVLNHYGPTETTIGVLTWEASEDAIADLGDAPLPLGFPLDGARVYVLDARRRAVPTGVSGEIYVAGKGVSRGYLNRPETIGERFVDDPFVGGRMYRTGDRGAVRADGAVVFLGRVDRQVKIRGYRIELAEVEAVIARAPGVLQVVVNVVHQADPRLVAYVRAADGASLDASSILHHVRTLLPAQMVPQGVVFVDAIPLTANGKIDYDALARIEAAPLRAPVRSPRDAVELQLTHIWRDVLRVDDVGIDDNFFDLGGHSLLATQLVARIEAAFGVRLPLSALFEYGTVRGMAERLRIDAPIAQSPLVLIRPGGDRTAMVFVHPAGGNVLCYYQLAQCLGPAVAFYALQAVGAGAPDVSIPRLARTYVDAVRARGLTGDLVLGGWSMGALVAFEMAGLLAREYACFPDVAVLDQQAPGAAPATADTDDLSRMVTFSAKVSELVGHDLGITHELLASRSETERTQLFLDRFVEHQLAPETATVDGFRGFLDLVLTHNRITGDYTPQPYAGRVLVFRAEESDRFGAARAADLGWQAWSRRPVEVVGVPGNHVSMMRDANVRMLAARLAERVLRAAVTTEAR